MVVINRAWSEAFGPKRDEVIGEWRKLHNKELNDLYSSSNVVRVIKSSRMTWAGHVAGERRIRSFGGEPEGKTALGRPRRRWEDNIKLGLQEVGCGGMDWIELAQNRDRW
jgi:PAS domain-containing protein